MSTGTVYPYDKASGNFYVWPVRSEIIECSTWNHVINKYSDYVHGNLSWSEVITCYTQYLN